MWVGERIYFSSDRSGVLNLYAYDVPSRTTEQLTSSDVWDLRWPSIDEASGRIVYEKAGVLEIFDPSSERTTPLVIRVPSDGLAKRASRIRVGDQISDAGLSPKGERVVLAARGDIFTVPVEHGRARNLTKSSGAHDREPAWSNDGERIAFVSDMDGEEEIYLIDEQGRGEPEQLTDGSTGRYYDLQWSPDSTHIAYRNQGGEVFVIDVASREVTSVADDPAPFGIDPAWSPHGGYLAFSLADQTGQRAIHIWSREDGSVRRVTGEMWNEHSPVWDPAGNYLFYLSEREFRPQLGSFEVNYAVNRPTQVYALALRADVGHPFPTRSDEVAKDGDAEGDEAEGDEAGVGSQQAKKGKKAKKAQQDAGDDEEDTDETIAIEFDGLAQRVARVPLDAGNYFGLGAVEGHLVYITGPQAVGRYTFSEIFPGHNEEDTYRSPFTEVGVGVSVGDYLLAINGEDVGSGDNPFALLRHAGGEPVELLVGSASAAGAAWSASTAAAACSTAVAFSFPRPAALT